MQVWLEDWRMRVNEKKCSHVVFSLRKMSSPPLRLNNIVIPQANEVTYLGIHLDKRLTWRKHIECKRTQIKLKALNLNWLLNKKSKLKLEHKVLLYNAAIKPIWTYGAQLWGTASTSNIELLQRAQSKILRNITSAPWYVKNLNIHQDLRIPFVKAELASIKAKYENKLRQHPNPLANNLSNVVHSSRLRRTDLPSY